jgi:hypothetical protein
MNAAPETENEARVRAAFDRHHEIEGSKGSQTSRVTLYHSRGQPVPNTERTTNAFATFSPYKSRLDRVLSKLTLLLGETNALTVRQQKFLHSMQFCPVSPKDLKRVGLSSQGLEHGALLFMSYYNRSRDAYFEGFAQGLWANMNEVWRYCAEWKVLDPPSAATTRANVEKVQHFIDIHERTSDSFFNGYREESASVRAALVLRREVDNLRTLAIEDLPSDEQFKQAFERLTQRLWGNAG